MRMKQLITLALFGVTFRAEAQLPEVVTTGTRVRATVLGGDTYTGTILQVRGDSLVVRDGGDAPVNIIASRNITALEVSEGRPFRRWDAIKWAGIAGAIVGGVV